MRRKQVTRSLLSVEEVRASLFAFRDKIGDRLDARVPPPSNEAAAVSYQAFFDHMDHELETVQSRLKSAEAAHGRRLVRVANLRRDVANQADGVFDKQMSARQVLAGLFGSDHNFELAGISGRTPQASLELVRQVEMTAELLREPEGERPKESVRGVSVDFGELATDLETDLEQLRLLRVDLGNAKKEAVKTQEAQNEELAEFNRVFPWIAQTLEGLFRLVGEFELADRIRTSARRVTRRRDTDDPEEGNESQDSAAQETATEEPASAPSEAAQTAPPSAES